MGFDGAGVYEALKGQSQGREDLGSLNSHR